MKVLCPAEEEEEGEGSPERKRQRHGEVDVEEAAKGEDGEEEARAVRGPIIPVTPSLEEVRQHRLTHRPFRSWCPHCVRGKGREDPHKKSTQKEVWHGVPKVVSDFFS